MTRGVRLLPAWFRVPPVAWVLALLLAGPGLGGPTSGAAEPDPAEEARTRTWAEMVRQAGRLGLPTEFLERIPPGFVRITFADLRSFAAEYHPREHVMVLNRALSLNAAGGTLRPLSRLTRPELATLYHELFHAYVDFVRTRADQLGRDEASRRLLAAARTFQACRYRQVWITPVRQRKGQAEMRFLTDEEAWEALNETWAVFVEWAVWTRLHLGDTIPGEDADRRAARRERWLALLAQADREGRLAGFYEPQDPQERALTHKRYLAPSHRITPAEVALLLETVLGASVREAERATGVMRPPDVRKEALVACPGEGVP